MYETNVGDNAAKTYRGFQDSLMKRWITSNDVTFLVASHKYQLH